MVILALTIALFVLGIPTLMFTLECMVGVVSRAKREMPIEFSDPTSAILVPAHNEAVVIESVLSSLCKQTGENDRIVVIADNCDDETAELARKFPVEVVERTSQTERGKGYALACGLAHVSGQPPEVVLVVDADCYLEKDALALLKHFCALENRPMQSQYLIVNKPNAGLQARISEFAVLVKNSVRMRASERLGIPAQLTGTGMAFPYACISEAQLASGEIVEDMKLGIDLAIDGAPSGYLDLARAHSYFPSSQKDLNTQRERWEHGHMGLIQHKIVPLLFQSLRQARPELFGLMLDLLIPPLAFLVVLVLTSIAITGFVAWYFKQLLILTAPIVYLILIICSVGLTWFYHGRSLLSGREISSLPVYVLSKLMSYLKFFRNREKAWKKTHRD